MKDFIVAAILVLLVGAAIAYLWKEKKKGRKCIGCAYSGTSACHCKDDRCEL